MFAPPFTVLVVWIPTSPDPKRLLRLSRKQGKRGKYGMLRTLGSGLDQKNKQKTTVAGGAGVICQEGHPKKERNKASIHKRGVKMLVLGRVLNCS